MKNKTCGECKHYDMHGGCNKILNTLWIHSTNIACIKFEAKNPTNGDRIRQMSNVELASKFGYPCPPLPNKHCSGISNEECTECWLNWLNAPADCVGKDTDVPAEDKKDYDLKALNFIYNKQAEAWENEIERLKAEATRFKRALHNLKEDCTRRKHFAVSDEEKLFLYETISHIEAELDFNTDTEESEG